MKLPIRTSIIVNGNEWDFGRRIMDAVLIDGVVVVTLVPDSGLPTIIAHDLERRVLWRDIDLPHFPGQDGPSLTAYSIALEQPLSFYIDAGYLLEVDLRSGQRLDTRFVK